MTLSISNHNNTCTVEMTEDLTIYEVGKYQTKLLAECDFNGQFKLDFSKLEDIDTAGVQLILSLDKQVKAAGGNILFLSTSPEMSKVLELFNLSEHFKSTDEAF